MSCLKGRTEKLNELSPFTDGMAYAPAGSAPIQIVSALKSNDLENLAKGDFQRAVTLRSAIMPLRRSVVVFPGNDVVPTDLPLSRADPP